VGALVRYVAATTLQWGLMVGAMWALQQVTSLPALPAWAPKVLVVLFFAVIALKSRIFSPLDNSRPTITKVD
jgi:benzodiazapine receptor